MARKLVLVTAGAGAGKTSFLTANMRRESSPHAWVTLDEHDRNPGVLLAHLLAALGADAGAADGRNREDVSDGVERGAVLAIHSLTAMGHGVVVLDDTHAIAGSASSRDLLAEIIRYAPDEITLVLAGREPLDVPIAKGRMRGEVALLDNGDLAYREDEAAALFEARHPGARMSPPHARRLVDMTEGWAAGIEIFLQICDRPDGETIEGTLERMRDARGGWFDYFAEEVIAHLPSSEQDFLERISALPRLHRELCDRFLGREDSGRLLDDLARRNLFTIPCDDASETYRLHSLFRAFLKARLRNRLSTAQLRDHLHRAARVQMDAGDFADAAETFAESGDAEATIELIERGGESLLAQGRYDVMLRTFRSLPERLLRSRPAALFVQARLHDFQCEWNEAEALYRRILRARPDPRRRTEIMGLIAQIASRRGRIGAAYAWCRKACRSGGRMDPTTHGRILATMGVCASEMGRFSEGERLLDQARSLYEKAEDPDGAFRIDYLRAINICLRRGELAHARALARRALLHFRRRRDPRRVCYSLGVLAVIEADAGNARDARDLADETSRIAERIAQREHVSVAEYVLGRAALLEGEVEEACRRFESAILVAEDVGQSVMSILPRVGLAEGLLAAGEREAARAAGNEAYRRAHAAGDRIEEAQALIVLGLIARETDPAAARLHWRRAEAILRRCGAWLDLWRLLLIDLDTGTSGQARERKLYEYLLCDGDRARGEGHDAGALLWSVEKERSARVLSRALRLGVGGQRPARLLHGLGDAAITPLRDLAREGNEEIARQAVQVLTRLGTPASRAALASIASVRRSPRVAALAAEEIARAPQRPLRIEALGRFRVSIGGDPLPGDRWKSARALRLFQLLLAHRFQWVPKDRLMDQLWPDADPDKAAGNLRQSVHQLRRALEPDLVELRESRYIRFQNDAYRLDSGDGGSYDVIEFESATREGERAARSGKTAAALGHLRRATEIYAGDFLEEHPYEDFAVEERERLRERALRGFSALAEALAARRQWGEAIGVCSKGLAIDAYHERLHTILVEAHFALGNRREALEVYHRYEALTTRELGLLPTARMRAIADRIASFGEGQAVSSTSATGGGRASPPSRSDRRCRRTTPRGGPPAGSRARLRAARRSPSRG